MTERGERWALLGNLLAATLLSFRPRCRHAPGRGFKVSDMSDLEQPRSRSPAVPVLSPHPFRTSDCLRIEELLYGSMRWSSHVAVASAASTQSSDFLLLNFGGSQVRLSCNGCNFCWRLDGTRLDYWCKGPTITTELHLASSRRRFPFIFDSPHPAFTPTPGLWTCCASVP